MSTRYITTPNADEKAAAGDKQSKFRVKNEYVDYTYSGLFPLARPDVAHFI